MKTTKIIAIAAAALLFAACGKDNADTRLRIFSENMAAGNGKVLIDPASPNGDSWVASETIDLNGTARTIAGNASEGFHLDNVEPLSETMYAIYPGGDFDDNDVEVTNNGTKREVVLNRLTVRFDGTGKHKIVFPMAAQADAGSGNLLFKHLSGGFRLTLGNSSVNGINVATVKVVAQSGTTVSHQSHNGFSARWAVQGPSVPTGSIGDENNDIDVKYSSEMVFDLRSGSNAYATVPASGSLAFCVPVTISSVRWLTIVGYATDGTESFRIRKDLCPNNEDEVAVNRNYMYTIPTLNIN